ncbi:cobalt-precorrin-4/precorrin-4 C(11)-methyltransferase [Jatrophihabitans fulvus]
MIHFVGAGPGAADLITLRAQRLLASCGTCVYAGSLVPDEVLSHCAPGTRLVDTADLTLDEIVRELVEADARGDDVVRLCSGDPSVFSAVAEQLRRLDAAGVAYDVTPGVPAFAAAAATLARELTVPTVAQSVVLTRWAQRATPMPAGEDVTTHATPGTTLVLHLAVQAIDEIVAQLVPVYGPSTPVAVVARASRDDELVLRGTLDTIASLVHEAGVKRTAVVLVGHALGTDGADSHLYSAERERETGQRGS